MHGRAGCRDPEHRSPLHPQGASHSSQSWCRGPRPPLKVKISPILQPQGDQRADSRPRTPGTPRTPRRPENRRPPPQDPRGEDGHPQDPGRTDGRPPGPPGRSESRRPPPQDPRGADGHPQDPGRADGRPPGPWESRRPPPRTPGKAAFLLLHPERSGGVCRHSSSSAKPMTTLILKRF